MVNTLYGEYGRHPKHFKPRSSSGHRSPRQPVRKNKVGKDGKRLTCFRCGSDAHFQTSGKCQPGAILAHARKRLQNGAQAVHLLSELISGMEGKTPKTAPLWALRLPKLRHSMLSLWATKTAPEEEEDGDEVMFTN